MKTVRELGGEIWAELNYALDDINDRLDTPIDQQVLDDLNDVIMGVLARHFGEKIINDTDLPVDPLPTRFFPDL